MLARQLLAPIASTMLIISPVLIALIASTMPVASPVLIAPIASTMPVASLILIAPIASIALKQLSPDRLKVFMQAYLAKKAA